jgi:hypothetical protein
MRTIDPGYLRATFTRKEELLLSRRHLIRGLIAGLAAAAMIAGPVTAASASNLTIKIALVHAAPALHRSDLRLRAAFIRYARSHRSGPVVRAIRAQDRDLSALRTRVRRTTASSSAGERARIDIIRGLGLVLRSNASVARHLHRQGAAGLSPSQLRTAERLARRGNAVYRRGIALLLHA